nr:tetraspanin-2A-like [Cherax quadricarinatus]XP_053648969.1 tetraspanin-2A-like [Cherax quadricarinatus]
MDRRPNYRYSGVGGSPGEVKCLTLTIITFNVIFAVGCCGSTGVLDYVRWNKVIPYTCYNPVTGNAWYVDGYGYMGCVRGFTRFLETKAAWIASVALFLAFFQICCFVAAFYLIRLKRDYQKSQDFLDSR